MWALRDGVDQHWMGLRARWTEVEVEAIAVEEPE